MKIHRLSCMHHHPKTGRWLAVGCCIEMTSSIDMMAFNIEMGKGTETATRANAFTHITSKASNIVPIPTGSWNVFKVQHFFANWVFIWVETFFAHCFFAYFFHHPWLSSSWLLHWDDGVENGTIWPHSQFYPQPHFFKMMRIMRKRIKNRIGNKDWKKLKMAQLGNSFTPNLTCSKWWGPGGRG